MRKHYYRYGDQGRFWGYALIALALLILFSKAWIFPLLFIAGIWWFVGRGMCRPHWHMDHFDHEKRKPEHDDMLDDDIIIV